MSLSRLPDYAATFEYVNDVNNYALQQHLQHHQTQVLRATTSFTLYLQHSYIHHTKIKWQNDSDIMDNIPRSVYQGAISLCNNSVSQGEDHNCPAVINLCCSLVSIQNWKLQSKSDARVDQELERLEIYNNKIDENTESLISIENFFSSENDNVACKARRLYHLACMNDLVEKHYNYGLKPNTLHLAMEYIATILVQGSFTFKTDGKPQIQVDYFRCVNHFQQTSRTSQN